MFLHKVYAFISFISSDLRMIIVVYTELGIASDICFIFLKIFLFGLI